ncbi:MAG: hypothetical protein HY905_04070 [Deltaproteobacteria bacterium]|nr:hypothetical protein [Deltaproteobacteria bacterium]
MPGERTEPVLVITLRVRGPGAGDYGIAKVRIPCSDIDWSLADGPRDCVGIDDIYQVDLRVERPGEDARSDTWDRA